MFDEDQDAEQENLFDRELQTADESRRH